MRCPGRDVSRGPGTWQRQILQVTSGTVVASVSGIVRTTLVSPDRNDYTSARRGAKGLALAQRVSAVYCWTCARCNQIQDSDDPEPCCGTVRPMLAVARPERRRLLLHPAPAPGGRVPPWTSVAVPPRPRGSSPCPASRTWPASLCGDSGNAYLKLVCRSYGAVLDRPRVVLLGVLLFGDHLRQQALRHDRRRLQPHDLVHCHRRGDRARRRGRSNLGPAERPLRWNQDRMIGWGTDSAHRACEPGTHAISRDSGHPHADQRRRE